ncbi:hypothetical protein G9X68_15200 [Rhizobium sp. WYCCWR 11279]|uniref:hypothetical protein n=1 Tax=Rhizobium changzhiense TaxID=2692317 RepID=UPI0014930E4C|nr:hypothetical protein [Rhizobium changzhiense]NNU48454.1 hypothetical protein [Rhizobium changzhiense]
MSAFLKIYRATAFGSDAGDADRQTGKELTSATPNSTIDDQRDRLDGIVTAVHQEGAMKRRAVAAETPLK